MTTTITAAANSIEEALYSIPHNTPIEWEAGELSRYIDHYAQRYVDGVDFVTTPCARMLKGIGQRPADADEAEQFAAIARIIYDSLNAAAVKRWLEAMPREQAAAIYAALGHHGAVIEYSCVRMTGNGLRDEWNELHPSDAIAINPDWLPSF